jgi:hypothetical protein
MAAILVRNLLLGLLAFAALSAFEIPTATAVVGCLTNEEARKIWPREHLYWHTGARCWDTSTPAEYRARAQPKPGPGISALGLAEATRYSLFLARLAGTSSPYMWLAAISWWPTSGQSFESKWNEDMIELAHLTSGDNAQLFAIAMRLPSREAAAHAGARLN